MGYRVLARPFYLGHIVSNLLAFLGSGGGTIRFGLVFYLWVEDGEICHVFAHWPERITVAGSVRAVGRSRLQ